MPLTPSHLRIKVLSLFELQEMFPDEDAAIKYLAGILWPDGPVCPYCGSKRVADWKSVKNFYNCKDCRKRFTIRTGTVMERSHIPLQKWLFCAYIMATARKGVSSMQLSKELGITQKSAWFLEMRIRAACGNQVTKMLFGFVECDETYLGGKEKNKHKAKKLGKGRGTVGKVAVLGMRERVEFGGRVVAKVIKATDKKTLQGAVNKQVETGSAVFTDEHKSYVGLDANGKYVHKAVKHSAKQFVDGMAHTNSIESVWAVLKRGFYGIFHWFSEKHTQFYIDEFVFRFNEGRCKFHTEDRIKSLVLGMRGKRLTWGMLRYGIYHDLQSGTP